MQGDTRCMWTVLPPEVEVYVLQHLVDCGVSPPTSAFLTLPYVRSTIGFPFVLNSNASALSSINLHYIYLWKTTSIKKQLPGDSQCEILKRFLKEIYQN